MKWVETKTAKFIEEEIVGVQFLSSNYSRTNAELIIFLRGGGEMRFMGEEAIELWERYGNPDDESDS
ncbi:MAG: hypothetical protein R2681_02815 [Pyrinomonadaceae bacterium]